MINVISPRGRSSKNSLIPTTEDCPLIIVIFASIARNAVAKGERPSLETSVPATVAELRMLIGASSLMAVLKALGQSLDSNTDCSVQVAPISRSLPFLFSEFKPRD